MAHNPKTEEPRLTTSGLRSRTTFVLLVGLGGLVMVGVLGAVIGFLGGAVAIRNARAVLLASVFTLLVTIALTLLEHPLTDSAIYSFPPNHSLANVAAAIAAVLLLAGLAGMTARIHRSPRPPLPADESNRTAPRVPTSTISAIVVACLLAALSLWWLGDRYWKWAGVALALAVFSLAGGFVLFRSRLGAGQRGA
jgi:hypothetical protein